MISLIFLLYLDMYSNGLNVSKLVEPYNNILFTRLIAFTLLPSCIKRMESQKPGIVRPAKWTLVIQPMEASNSFLLTVIA